MVAGEMDGSMNIGTVTMIMGWHDECDADDKARMCCSEPYYGPDTRTWHSRVACDAVITMLGPGKPLAPGLRAGSWKLILSSLPPFWELRDEQDESLMHVHELHSASSLLSKWNGLASKEERA